MTGESPANAMPASKYDLFLAGLLAVSLAGNAMLGLAFVRITSKGDEPPVVSQSRVPVSPPIGAQVPGVEGSDLNGKHQVLQYSSDSRPTVLYIFSPECRWCARNLPNLRALLQKKSSAFRFVGLSLDPSVDNVKRYLTEEKLDIPVILSPTPEVVAALGLGVTPHTMVISPSGRLQRSWMGAFVGRNAKDVESFFEMALPGLTSPLPAPSEH